MTPKNVNFQKKKKKKLQQKLLLFQRLKNASNLFGC